MTPKSIVRNVIINGSPKDIEFRPTPWDENWYQADGMYRCPCGGVGILCIHRKSDLYGKPYINCGYCLSATELESFKEVK